MEHGATPNWRSLRVSRGGKGKVLTQSPENHPHEVNAGEVRANRDDGRRSPQRRRFEKGKGELANSEQKTGA